MDFRFFEMGQIFLKGGMIAVVASHTHRRRHVTWAIIGLAPAVLLFSAWIGRRGDLIIFVLVLGWVFSQRVRRIPAPLVATAALVAALLTPVMREWRETGSIAETSRMRGTDLLSNALVEMGSTALTFAYTLDYVPSRKNYGYGLSFVGAFLHLIPNPTLRPGAKAFLPDVEEHDPASWLVATLNPQFASQGGGYGYSLGGEWYFNFGVVGVLVGATLHGYLVAHFRNNARRTPLALAWSGLFFHMSVLAVRNVISWPLKTAVWPFLGLLLLGAVSTRWFGSGAPRADDEAPGSERLARVPAVPLPG
jgi:hypothetical protein